jgi:hypothetical protein
MVSKNSIFTLSEFVKTESPDATSHEARNNSAKAIASKGWFLQKCVQLASQNSTPYTEFAAILNAEQGKAAAERACPLRKPGLTRVISSANFIL